MDNSYFPIRIEVHLILALLALLVFGMQFIRFRKSHHLVLAIALPCTLLPYLFDNQTFFYTVGVAEGAALVLSLILAYTIDRDKTAPAASSDSDDAPETQVPAETVEGEKGE